MHRELAVMSLIVSVTSLWAGDYFDNNKRSSNEAVVVRNSDDIDNRRMVFNLFLNWLDENSSEKNEALRSACQSIDIRREEIFLRFPELENFNAEQLKHSVCFNRYNEWCGVSQKNGTAAIVFGNELRWAAHYIPAHDPEWFNKFCVHNPISFVPVLLGKESAFSVPNMCVIPMLQEIRIYENIEPEIFAFKKSYPLLLAQSQQISANIGSTPLVTRYRFRGNRTDPQWDEFNQLYASVMDSKHVKFPVCECRSDNPSEKCKEACQKLLTLAADEQLATPLKENIIKYALKGHIFHRLKGEGFDQLQYYVDIYANQNMKITNKNDQGKIYAHPFPEKDTIEEVDLSEKDLWERQQIVTLEYAQGWVCKDSLVYHCHSGTDDTTLHIFSHDSPSYIRQIITIPNKQLYITNIVHKNFCFYYKNIYVFIYCKDMDEKKYLIILPHKVLHHQELCSWYRCSVQDSTVEMINTQEAYIRALTQPDMTQMQWYRLNLKDHSVAWNHINLINKLKQSYISLKEDELRNLELLPHDYAQQLQKIVVRVPSKGWLTTLGDMVVAPFWNYTLMNRCFYATYNQPRPFISDVVYCIGALCTLSLPILPSMARVIGIGAIVRFVTSRISMHATDVSEEASFKEQAHPLMSKFVTSFKHFIFLCAPFLSSDLCDIFSLDNYKAMGYLSPMLWGLFDGVCMFNSYEKDKVDCAYSDIWLSYRAQLRRLYYKNRVLKTQKDS